MISGCWYSVYPAPNGSVHLFRFDWNSGFAKSLWTDKYAGLFDEPKRVVPRQVLMMDNFWEQQLLLQVVSDISERVRNAMPFSNYCSRRWTGVFSFGLLSGRSLFTQVSLTDLAELHYWGRIDLIRTCFWCCFWCWCWSGVFSLWWLGLVERVRNPMPYLITVIVVRTFLIGFKLNLLLGVAYWMITVCTHI